MHRNSRARHGGRVLVCDDNLLIADVVAEFLRECGFTPKENFESGIAKTVRWYIENAAWVRAVRSGTYREWIEKNYAARG